MNDYNGKLVHPVDLLNRSFKLVFTNGVFDLFHQGHDYFLWVAMAQGGRGGRLIVSVNDDESVRRLKGPGRPINPLSQRLADVASVPFVDYVCVQGDTPLQAIRECQPDVLVKGDDYRGKNVIGTDLVPVVVLVPRMPGYSTTALIERLRAQEAK